MRALFPDTKPAENLTQQIIGRKLACYFAQRLMCESKLFGEQFQRNMLQMRCCTIDMYERGT